MGISKFSIYTKFAAKDGVSPTLTAVTKKTSILDKTFARLGLRQKGFGGSFASTMKTANFLMKSFIGLFAIGQIKDFFQKSTEAATVQLAAEQKLTQALKNNAAIRARGNDAYLKSSKELMEFASKIQQKGILGDEMVLGGMQTLGSMGFDDSQIKKVIPSIADLVVQQKGYNATVEDFENASKGIGRAIAGNSGALSRMGIVLDKNEKKMFSNMTTAQRTEFVTKLLTKRVGGMNEEFAKTDKGAKVNFMNKLGDQLEEIGKRFMPYEGKFFRTLNKHFPTMVKLVDKLFDAIDWGVKAIKPVFDELGELFKYISQEILPEFGEQVPTLKFVFEKVIVPGCVLAIEGIKKLCEAFKSLYDFVEKAFSFIKENWLPLLLVLPAAFVGCQVAVDTLRVKMALARMEGGLLGMVMNTKLVQGLSAFTAGVWKSVTAIAAQTAAWLASPIGLITLGVVALVGVVILLWKNWDKVKEFGLNCFKTIGDAISKFWNGCKTVFSAIGNFIKNNFIDILLMALGPVGQIINLIRKMPQILKMLGFKGDPLKIETKNGDKNPTKSPRVKGGGIGGKVVVETTINNNTGYGATTSATLMNGSNLQLAGN